MRTKGSNFSRSRKFSHADEAQSQTVNTGGSSDLPADQQSLIREFIQALAEEIETIKMGRGGSTIAIYDGRIVRREGPFFVYVFTTESPLIVMDDAPAEVEIGGNRFPGQVASVQGSEVAIAIEKDLGTTIAEAWLITNLWYLLEALRKRYEEVLNGQRRLDSCLCARLFGLAPVSTRLDGGELNLPPSSFPPDQHQLEAIRYACGSDIDFVWGPPGTGKTQTIGFLVAALVRRKLRVLVVSHTNVATDNAIAKTASLNSSVHTDLERAAGRHVQASGNCIRGPENYRRGSH